MTLNDDAPVLAGDAEADRWLCRAAGQAELLGLITQLPLSANRLARLRNELGQPRAARLLQAAEQAVAARAKLLPDAAEGSGCSGGSAQRLPLVTSRALQQASDWQLAAYKASQFPPQVAVVDLCCGVGGDAIALSHRGPLLAVDRDPQMCRYAAHNLSQWGGAVAAVLCEAAEDLQLPNNIWLHLDPDRRPQQRRTSAVEHSSPDAETIAKLIERVSGAALKLAPAATIPATWPQPQVREWISRGGSCRQQVAWFLPTKQPAMLRATCLLPSGQPESFTIATEQAEQTGCSLVDQPQLWMFDFDPAIRAAGLSDAFAESLGLAAISSPAGFFTAEQPAAGMQFSALVRGFRTCWRGPMDVKKIKQQLGQMRVARLEIKVRGIDLKPEQLRPKLLSRRPSGAAAADAVLLIGGRNRQTAYAAIAHRA